MVTLTAWNLMALLWSSAIAGFVIGILLGMAAKGDQDHES